MQILKKTKKKHSGDFYKGEQFGSEETFIYFKTGFLLIQIKLSFLNLQMLSGLRLSHSRTFRIEEAASKWRTMSNSNALSHVLNGFP